MTTHEHAETILFKIYIGNWVWIHYDVIFSCQLLGVLFEDIFCCVLSCWHFVYIVHVYDKIEQTTEHYVQKKSYWSPHREQDKKLSFWKEVVLYFIIILYFLILNKATIQYTPINWLLISIIIRDSRSRSRSTIRISPNITQDIHSRSLSTGWIPIIFPITPHDRFQTTIASKAWLDTVTSLLFRQELTVTYPHG